MTQAYRNCLALLLSIACAGPAAAHPALTDSEPKAGAVITASPRAVSLHFNEALIAKFSGLVIKNTDGQTLEIATATTTSNDAKQLIIALKTPLPPGAYTVEWHAVSVDTHRVKGSYSFTVAP